MTVSEHDQERLQALESELSNTKAELARVVREQALAAESLRASEELKSRLIACSRDCIKILDLEGRLLFMNEGGMQVLEICDIGPFLNSCWVEFWEGADREAAEGGSCERHRTEASADSSVISKPGLRDNPDGGML